MDKTNSSLLEREALEIYEGLPDEKRKQFAIYGIMICMRFALLVIRKLASPGKGGDA